MRAAAENAMAPSKPDINNHSAEHDGESTFTPGLKSAPEQQSISADLIKKFNSAFDAEFHKGLDPNVLKDALGGPELAPPKYAQGPGGLGVMTYDAASAKPLTTRVRRGDEEKVESLHVDHEVMQVMDGRFEDQDYWIDAQGHTHNTDDKPPPGTHIEQAGCSHTTARQVLASYGRFETEESLDLALRAPLGLGGSLENLRQVFADQGLAVQQGENGSWDELKDAVTQGYGVMLSYTHEGGPHTVRVRGFAAEGTNEYVVLQDVDGRGLFTVPRADFEKQWQDVRVFGKNGLDTGIHRTYMVVGPPGAHFPHTPSLGGALAASSSLTFLDGVHNLLIVPSYVSEGDVPAAAMRAVGGLIEVGLQIGPIAVQYTGSVLRWAGRQLDETAKTLAASSNIFANIASFFVAIAGLFLGLTGFIVESAGQAAGALTSIFAKSLSFLFRRAADALHADNDAENAVRFADPKGTTREQRYWQDLCTTPAVPGKSKLIAAMLTGNLTAHERQMILRVLASCIDFTAVPVVKDLKALVTEIGRERLVAAFAGTPEAEALAKQLLPLDAPPPSAPAPAPTTTAPIAPAPATTPPAPGAVNNAAVKAKNLFSNATSGRTSPNQALKPKPKG